MISDAGRAPHWGHEYQAQHRPIPANHVFFFHRIFYPFAGSPVQDLKEKACRESGAVAVTKTIAQGGYDAGSQRAATLYDASELPFS